MNNSRIFTSNIIFHSVTMMLAKMYIYIFFLVTISLAGATGEGLDARSFQAPI